MSSLVLFAAGLTTGVALVLAAPWAVVLAPVVVLLLPRWPIVLAGLLLGLWAGHLSGGGGGGTSPLPDLRLPGRYLVTARVRDAAPPTAEGQRATLSVETIDGRSLPGVGIRLGLPGPWLRPGDRIRGTLRLSRPSRQRNPGGLDRRARAERAGVQLQGWAYTPEQVVVLRRGRGLGALVARLRHGAARRLDARLEPADAGLARALVLGDRSGLTAADRRRFAETGQGHLVAVSGLHVGIVLAGCLFLLRRTGLGLVGSWAAGLLLVGFYVPFAGAAPSTVRAGAGAAIYFAGRLLGRRSAPPTVLATVVIVVLAIVPGRLREPGFTLSVAAVLGILVLHRRLVRELVPAPVVILPGLLPPPRTPVRTALALSLSAWLGTAPLLTVVLGRLCPAAAPLSVLTVPVTGVVIGAAFLVLLPVPGVEALGQLAVAAGAGTLRVLLDGVVRIRLGALPATPGGPLWLGLYGTALVVAGFGSRRASRLALLALFLLLLVTLVPRRATPPGVPRLWLLAVGEGQAAVLLLPDGRAALLDAGRLGDPAVGRRLILPALRALGVRRLDLAVASHADADHTGGLADVHAEYAIPLLCVAPGMQASLAHCAQEVRSVRRGQILLEGGWGSLRVLAPTASTPRERSDNDAGLVLLLETEAGIRALLPGDREADGIRSWLAAEEDPRADVLLLPHHGHRDPGREAAVEAVRPLVRLASCGPGTVPDLPPETWATAERGAIRVDLTPEGPRVAAPWHPGNEGPAYDARPPMPVTAPVPIFPIVLAVAGALGIVGWLSVRPFGWLTPAGALGATVLGLTAWSAFGGAGLAALLAPFVVASSLGRLPGTTRSGARTLRQVAANGIPALLGCVLTLAVPTLAPAGAALFVGALACLGSDTCATEIGVRYGGDPRTLVPGREVRRGESGGVTRAGLLASLGGAALAPLAYFALAGLPSAATLGALLFAGVAGSLLDSLLGATWEYRMPGEGVRWLDNDGVNLASGLAAGVIALGLAA